ncbi:MAG TPA: Hsp70 family protein [Acidobacteriaceae bacterium]|jgi:molecular chaperone DnaK (HSP70)|nr:Hsp70 family protein [Acidobacteriaceae bacterium]
MRIGIDFGTTRVVVAAADRGNFPLVHFETPDGQTCDWFPPIAAVRGNTRLYGWQAVPALEDDSFTVLRSLKRSLRLAGPNTELRAGGRSLPLRLLLTEMMTALRMQLLEHSNLGAKPGEPLEIMLGVPANANSNQRFLTEEAAQAAGFTVLGLMNEPSAAAIEFACRNSAEHDIHEGRGLLVYDLGGGTFDVSLVTLGNNEHIVEASDGIPDLGGDDFDQILCDLALGIGGLDVDLTGPQWFRLREECREKKESLNPNTRKLIIDLERVHPSWPEVTVPVDVFYDLCRPLIEATRDVVEGVLAANTRIGLDTLYVTGGGSELPPVARILRETFGRKVRRSAYMRSASAIGLAIRASTQTEHLRDRFNQNFGIWREAESGEAIVFDLIFPRGARLPAPGEPALSNERDYQPVHNVGHFRYIECSRLDASGQPTGDITNWQQIRFPFDPRLQRDSDRGPDLSPDLSAQPVQRLVNPGPLRARERYTCDASGTVRVMISAEPGGYTRDFLIGQAPHEEAARNIAASASV